MFQVSPIVYFLFPLRCVADLLRSTFFFYNGTYSFYCLPSCASALLVSFPILMSIFTQLPSLLPSTFSLLLSPTDSASECLCFSLTHSYLSRPPSYFCVGPVGFYPYSPGFFFFAITSELSSLFSLTLPPFPFPFSTLPHYSKNTDVISGPLLCIELS